GDNPCSLATLGLSEEGAVAVSLGTSDTVMGITKAPTPQEEARGYIREKDIYGGKEAYNGRYFVMLVYKNGSLVRERIRDE
ncbi:unnamed protein product, partial [Choristocarpus tenellus]